MDILPTQPLAQAIPLDGPVSPSGDLGSDDPFVALLAALLQPQALSTVATAPAVPPGKDAPELTTALAPAAPPMVMPADPMGAPVGDPAAETQPARAPALPPEVIRTRFDAVLAADPANPDMPQAAASLSPAALQAGNAAADERPDPSEAAKPGLRERPAEAERRGRHPAHQGAADGASQMGESLTTTDAPPGSTAYAHAAVLQVKPSDQDTSEPVPQRLPDGPLPASLSQVQSPPVPDAPAAIQAPAATPPVTLPSPDHRGRVVSAQLVVAPDGQASSVWIDLEPADLGRVEVALRMDDAGLVSATFTVDRPETLQLLQRDARTVGELLGSAGLMVQEGALGFTLRDSPGGQHGGERGQRGGGSTPGRGDAAPPAQPLASRRGLLDLRV
jgi:flagellar hook-length control protein FliK